MASGGFFFPTWSPETRVDGSSSCCCPCLCCVCVESQRQICIAAMRVCASERVTIAALDVIFDSEQEIVVDFFYFLFLKGS